MILFGWAIPALSHELWVAPENYQVEKGAPLAAHLRNGQDFDGYSLVWFDKNIRAIRRYQNGDVTPLTGRPGDRPAIQMEDAGNGLMVLSYESTPSVVSYDDFEVFKTFVDYENLTGTLESHKKRGLPQTGFKEVYTRFSKALIGVGDAQGNDQRLGLETEIVAFDNPYATTPDAGIRVGLYYSGAPRMAAQIKIFDKAPDGTVTTTDAITDADGVMRMPVARGHEYLLSSVVIRVPDPDLAKEKDAVWETLWAALTFAIPESAE